MINKKYIGIIVCGIGLAMFVFILLFIFSVFSTFSGAKSFSGLSSIFLGSKFFPPVGIAVFVITMLIFSLSSIFLGSKFFLYSWLQSYYRIAQVLILASGVAYITNSIFLFSRLKRWVRKLIFAYSIILIIYFVPLSIFISPAPLGGGLVMVLSFSPYIIVPLFFIIFLTHPKVKEQIKK